MYSDKKLKTNINILNNINKNLIYDLKSVEYNWINDNNDFINKNKKGKYDVGFIAQDVEKVAPHLVSEIIDIKSGNIYKGIKYEKIIPYLVQEV